MSNQVADREPSDEDVPWQQKIIDNLWILLALSLLIPGLIYLAWGLWELANVPTWGGK